MAAPTRAALALIALIALVASSQAAPAATPASPAPIKEPTPAAAAAAPKAAAAPAAPAAAAAPKAATTEDDAAVAAAQSQIDLSSIPKVASSAASSQAVSVGGSTAVGQNITKASGGKSIPLTGFEPAWPADKPNTKDQVLIDVITDTSVANIKPNQVPFIQSLAEALGVSTKQVFWYKIQSADLNRVTFLVDSQSPQEKQAVLASLANPDNTGRFYSNAAAYTLNILNGPEVAPEELQLSADVISKPDDWRAYNGDTGVVTNNATKSAAGATPAPSAFGTTLLGALGGVALAALAL